MPVELLTERRIGLELEARPESVALVRSVLAGLVDTAGIDQALLNDLKTAVSEACNNVVLHAYSSDSGPLLVTIWILPTSIDVNVRDRGVGIRRLTAAGRMGLGLGLMTALATRAEFTSPQDGGTEVRMSFERFPGAGSSQARAFQAAVDLPAEPVGTLPGSIIAHVSSASLVGPVFGRLARAVAASSGFSVTRFHDLYPIADLLAAQANRVPAGWMSFSIEASLRSMELIAGPFNTVPDAGAFGELVDRFSVETVETGQKQLHLTLLDQARRSRVG